MEWPSLFFCLMTAQNWPNFLIGFESYFSQNSEKTLVLKIISIVYFISKKIVKWWGSCTTPNWHRGWCNYPLRDHRPPFDTIFFFCKKKKKLKEKRKHKKSFFGENFVEAILFNRNSYSPLFLFFFFLRGMTIPQNEDYSLE